MTAITQRWMTAVTVMLTVGSSSIGSAICVRTCAVTLLGSKCTTPTEWPGEMLFRIGAQCERTCCTRPDPGPGVCDTEPESTLPEFFCFEGGGGAFSFAESICGYQFELSYDQLLESKQHRLLFSPYNGDGTCGGTVVADFGVEQRLATEPTPECSGVCDGGPCLTAGGEGGNCLETAEGCQCVLEVTPTSTPTATPTEFFPTCCLDGTCPRLCGPTATPVPACEGDCDADRTVRVNELVTAVRIALGALPESFCPTLNCSPGPPGIDCLVRAVSNALEGCQPIVPNVVPTLPSSP